MRRLSDPEFAQFMTDEQGFVTTLMPGQSAIVDWNGLKVLAYIGSQAIDVGGDLYPDVYLSEVSDAPQLAAMTNPAFHAPSQTWYEALPPAVLDAIKNDAANAGVLLNSLAQQIGNVAGGLTQPLLSNLTFPIVAIGFLAAMYYLPRRST